LSSNKICISASTSAGRTQPNRSKVVVMVTKAGN